MYIYTLYPEILRTPVVCHTVYLYLLYECVNKNQLDTQLILSVFRQPLHVSGVSRSIIRRHNRMCTTVGTYCSF
jgi:hypothetical protein